MIGFHIDMNTAQFRGDYLKKWLKELADLGYDTIIWEVENNIQWETCPECVAPEAFSKQEFKEILALCKSLGLNSIPLLQVLAHSSYVLIHETYRDLSEGKNSKGMYCPRNEDARSFLHKWIDEYLELFEGITHFHLGADEAGGLGTCEDCADFVSKTSLSELFVQHINAMSEPLAKKGVTPIIWSDMLIRHPEALDKMSRDVMLFDWRYEIYHGIGRVPVKIFDRYKDDEIPDEVLKTFGEYLYPLGKEPGRDPDPFYTADYLADKGFQVVTCPASSCFKDSVFAPLTTLRMRNTFDSLNKGSSGKLHGSVVTSWTVRLTPWELQLSSMNISKFIKEHPGDSLENYQDFFMKKTFGVVDKTFWRACAHLSRLCSFMESRALGFYKMCRPVHEDRAKMTLDLLEEEGHLDKELKNTEAVLKEYQKAEVLFEEFSKKAKAGHEQITIWIWAARNMIHRARVSNLLIRCRIDQQTKLEPKNSRYREAKDLLEGMKELRQESKQMYLSMQKPQRTGELLGWMYNSVQWGLEGLVTDE